LIRRSREAGIRSLHSSVFALIIAAVGVLFSFAETPKLPASFPDAKSTLAYLNQTIDWHRHLAIEQQLATDSTDLLLLENDRQTANDILRLSFDFARAEAERVVNRSPSNDEDQSTSPTRYQSLAHAVASADTEVKQDQAEIESLNQKLQAATGRKRQQLQSQIDETQSELNLAQVRSQTLKNLLQFASSAAGAGGDLLSQINELQHSIPELNVDSTRNGSTRTNVSSASTNAQIATKRAPSGILELATDLVALTHKMHTLDQTIALTDSLSQSAEKLRAPLISTVARIAQQGDQLAKQADTSDPTQLRQLKQQLDGLTADYKQVSTVLLPLGKQSLLFGLYKSNLTRWRGTVKSQFSTELRGLVLRLVVLVVVLLVIYGLAEIWRKTTLRYIRDVRRRHQLLLLRRIALWCASGITIAFALATQLGSLITFAGLITAGIAVALQNVILAVVGYFFLIGKYGVRVGDRVQISGVTGDVLDIGLVRLHLMEIGGSGAGHQPTGRVVAFSNSVVFQPNASLFKQIPGTNFVWHEVTLILAPDSDYRLAEERMLAVVEKIYADYRDSIERQHRAMQQNLSVIVDVPRPQSRLRLTQTGLEVVICYPTLLEDAAEIDDRIARELLQALEQPPRLKLVGSGTPNIQPARDGAGTMVPEAAARGLR